MFVSAVVWKCMCGLHCHHWTVKPTQGVLINGIIWGNDQNGSTNNNIKQYQQQSQKEEGGKKKGNEGITYSWEQYINHPKGAQNLQQIRFHHPAPHPQHCGLRRSRLYPCKNTHRHRLFLSFRLQQLFPTWMIPWQWDISGQRDVIIYWWSASHAGWVGDWCENLLCCFPTLRNLYVFVGESALPQCYSHSLRSVCVLKWTRFCFVPGFHLWLPNTAPSQKCV